MNDEYYFTQSLNIAAYLISKGFEVKRTETNSVGIMTFFFERSEKTHDLIMAYNSNDELKKFIAAFREIKRLAHTVPQQAK